VSGSDKGDAHRAHLAAYQTASPEAGAGNLLPCAHQVAAGGTLSETPPAEFSIDDLAQACRRGSESAVDQQVPGAI
jgi:hypothetical protein